MFVKSPLSFPVKGGCCWPRKLGGKSRQFKFSSCLKLLVLFSARIPMHPCSSVNFRIFPTFQNPSPSQNLHLFQHSLFFPATLFSSTLSLFSRTLKYQFFLIQNLCVCFISLLARAFISCFLTSWRFQIMPCLFSPEKIKIYNWLQILRRRFLFESSKVWDICVLFLDICGVLPPPPPPPQISAANWY